MNCDWTIFPGLSDCHAGPTWCYGTPNCSGMGFLQKKEGPSVLAGFTLDGAAPVRFLPPCELAKLAAAARRPRADPSSSRSSIASRSC
jgi:hypothetical protein